jgi:hypothetical protein
VPIEVVRGEAKYNSHAGRGETNIPAQRLLR